MPRSKKLSSPSSTPAADLAKQRRELAEKSEYLTKWENDLANRQTFLDTASSASEVKYRTLEGKIEASQTQLGTIRADIDKAQELAKEKSLLIRKQTSDYTARKDEARVTYDKVHTAVTQLEQTRKTVQAGIRQVSVEIKERKDYYREQEELIDASITAGNGELGRLNREIKKLETEHEDMLLKLHETVGQATKLEQQTQDKATELQTLTERYTQAASGYRNDLVEIRTEIATAQRELAKTKAETSATLLDVKAKLTELEVVREVTAKQKAEVLGEKRRLDSMRGAYGL